MNKFQFMGRLTKDPETRYTQNTNTPVSTFSIAVNRRFTEANGERKADFFNVTAFGKLAEFCSKYYKKGQQVLVEDQSGQKRYATDYIIENAYFADSRRDTSSNDINDFGETPTSSDDGEFITVDDTDELPF